MPVVGAMNLERARFHGVRNLCRMEEDASKEESGGLRVKRDGQARERTIMVKYHNRQPTI